MTTRRRFLRDTLAGSALLSMSGPVPGFLRAAVAAGAGSAPAGEKILVVLQLSGGNDGLNTVIPYKDDLYFRARPSIAADPRTVIPLNGELGLHPSLAGLGKLWQDKQLTVVEGVGYPNHSQSHFVSMDIWHSARPEKPDKRSGWLGRSLAADPNRRSGRLGALSLGSRELPPALVGDGVEVPAIEDLKDFHLRIEGGSAHDRERRRALIADLSALPRGRDAASDSLAFVSDTMKTTFAAAEALAKVTAGAKERVTYPADHLGRSLQQIGQVIAAGFGTRIFYCSIGGFDTHAKQAAIHTQLLARVSAAVSAFWQDMKAQGRDKDVLLFTFSEFGRRVAQNASHGTDHGTAAPMFILGGRNPGGLVGKKPDLTDLTAGGDLKHQIDFRQVYAAVLDRWLGIDSEKVLGRRFEPVGPA